MESKETLLDKIDELKRLYKKKKEKLEFADNEVEEEFIKEEMEKYRLKIKELKKKIEEIQKRA